MFKVKNRKVLIFLFCFPILVSLLFSMFPATVSAAELGITLRTPSFYEDSTGSGNLAYSLFAYDTRTEEVIDKFHYYEGFTGLSAYVDGEPLYNPVNMSWIDYGSSVNTSFYVNGYGGNNSTFYYRLPQNSYYGTYLCVTRYIYDSVMVPNGDYYFRVSYEYDYFWNEDRAGADVLEPILEEVMKPLLRFHTGSDPAICDYVEPVLIRTERVASRSYNLTAWFNLTTEQILDISGGDRYEYMQLIVPFVSMLPGTGNIERTYSIDTYTSFPTQYRFLDRGDYVADLLEIKNLIEDQNEIFTVSRPVDDLYISEVQDYIVDDVVDYNASLSDYFGDLYEIKNSDLITVNPSAMLPAETDSFLDIMWLNFNSPLFSPLILAGLIFGMVRVILVGVG